MSYFLVSDLHGQYSKLMRALDKADFDGEKDTLINLGDLFDRGEESAELLHFVMSLPKKILICGNHELILKEVLERKYLKELDYWNGVHKTMLSIFDISMEDLYYSPSNFIKIYEQSNFQKLRDYFNELVWYCEGKQYHSNKNILMVHSWFPFDYNGEMKKETTLQDWKEATWNETDKMIDLFSSCKLSYDKIIFGHWHTELLNNKYKKIKNNFGIFDYNKFIGIDGCHSLEKNQINVLKIEFDEIKIGNKIGSNV